MTSTHFTTDELVMIESYFHQNSSVAKIAVYFTDPRTPSQRALNENPTRILRKDGFQKNQ